MQHTAQPTPRLLTRASASRCAHCPPDRVCAWDCIQGAGAADIVVGAVLEQSPAATYSPPVEPGVEMIQEALWELFNA